MTTLILTIPGGSKLYYPCASELTARHMAWTALFNGQAEGYKIHTENA